VSLIKFRTEDDPKVRDLFIYIIKKINYVTHVHLVFILAI